LANEKLYKTSKQPISAVQQISQIRWAGQSSWWIDSWGMFLLFLSSLQHFPLHPLFISIHSGLVPSVSTKQYDPVECRTTAEPRKKGPNIDGAQEIQGMPIRPTERHAEGVAKWFQSRAIPRPKCPQAPDKRSEVQRIRGFWEAKEAKEKQGAADQTSVDLSGAKERNAWETKMPCDKDEEGDEKESEGVRH
jgi:hypothetical protein